MQERDLLVKLETEHEIYHEQASPQKASKNDYHEPQQNLLPQQNSPALDKGLLYLQVHILEQEFHTFQDTRIFHQEKQK